MILELKSVIKNYEQSHQSLEILKGVNLAIERGETVAIVGESGSGKSTLLHLIAGLDEPDSGAVNFVGQTLSSLSETERARLRGERMGIVYQQFHLLGHLTALENVRLPLQMFGRENDLVKAIELLDLVGLSHRLTHFPHQLSGGECQRVALARAICLSPELILADEPSGNLDSRTGAVVMDSLFSLVKEKNLSLVLVTHSQELAKKCKRVLRLTGGILVAHDT